MSRRVQKGSGHCSVQGVLEKLKRDMLAYQLEHVFDYISLYRKCLAVNRALAESYPDTPADFKRTDVILQRFVSSPQPLNTCATILSFAIAGTTSQLSHDAIQRKNKYLLPENCPTKLLPRLHQERSCWLPQGCRLLPLTEMSPEGQR